MPTDKEIFEKMIAEQRRKHEDGQKPKSLAEILIKKEERKCITHRTESEMRHIERKIYEDAILGNINLVTTQEEYNKNLIVPVVLDTIMTFLLNSIHDLLIESHLTGRKSLEIAEEMRITACGLQSWFDLYIKMVEDGNNYIRRHWMESGFSVQLQSLKNAYLQEIVNSDFRYKDANANDLMAWCYTLYSLCMASYRYCKHFYEEIYRRGQEKNIMVGIKDYTFNRHYPSRNVANVMKKWIKHCKFPVELTSKNIELGKNVIYNQIQLVDIQPWIDNAQMQMEGKTTKIA